MLVDSSKVGGIGYILLQVSEEILPNGMPRLLMIRCNSIAPKKEWRGYSPIEMELLGLFWSFMDCSYYILGS